MLGHPLLATRHTTCPADSGPSVPVQFYGANEVPGVPETLSPRSARRLADVVAVSSSIDHVAEVGIHPAPAERLEFDGCRRLAPIRELNHALLTPTGGTILLGHGLSPRSVRRGSIGLRCRPLRCPAGMRHCPNPALSRTCLATVAALAITSDSQTRITCQPACASCSVTSRSRCIFRSILATHQSVRVGNSAARFGKPLNRQALPCQKSPSTKMASLRDRITRSGWPRTSLAWRR